MKMVDLLAELRSERRAIERLTSELRDIVGSSTSNPGNSTSGIAAGGSPDLTHLECYKFCHDKLCSENELTNNRLSWSFTIHGFLFAAYALSLQTIGNLKISLTKLDPEAALPLERVIATLNGLTRLISWTGILVSVFIAVGAFAAQLAIFAIRGKFHDEHLEHKKGSFWKTHGTHFPGVTGGGSTLAHIFGAAPLFIPVVFAVIWSLVLVYLPVR